MLNPLLVDVFMQWCWYKGYWNTELVEWMDWER